jgi:hypothetical protein
VGKIIFALLTAAIAWVLFKGLMKKPPDSKANSGDAAKPGDGKTKNLNAPERMVKCVRCGVFMPETESVIVGGQISCRDPQTCAHGRA